jgi:3-phosphoshikimate 1-carboxyvinyltransferase
VILRHAARIEGAVRVPGDKSIAHRALILGAMSRGKQLVDGVPNSADVQSTIACLRELGVLIEAMPDGRTLVLPRKLAEPQGLFAGNSGTTARLLSGLAAGQPFTTRIDGDASLRRRPMARVAEPLAQMGADIATSAGGRLPITIRGGSLKGITYHLPVASAQVKSAVLIAGLQAEGETVVVETVPTRDHTERLLQAMGAPIDVNNGTIRVRGAVPLRAVDVKIPGDISSAAFFMVATTCLKHSEIYLPTTGVNPTRTGVVDVLRAMGGSIEMVNSDTFLGEPVADLVVRSSSLRGLTIDETVLPSLIDELPVIAVAATQAEGETIVTGAAELRHKESDRIAAIVGSLKRFGADIEERGDGFAVRGPTPLRGARVSSHGDHRIAMAMAVAGVLADGETEIEHSAVVDVSYPRFFTDLNAMLR